MLDLTFTRYHHETDWALCKPLFEAYNFLVNEGKIPDLEKWVMRLPGHIKLGLDLENRRVVGFLAYETPYKGDIGLMSVEALYILPELRYNGLLRAFMSTFPGVDRVRFALHKSRRESPNDPMLTGMLRGHCIGSDPQNPRLEIWEARWNPTYVPGSNKAMETLRKSA